MAEVILKSAAFLLDRVSRDSAIRFWAFCPLEFTQVTPVGFNSIGYQYHIIFAVLNAALVPTVYLFFPETNSRTLEEIDEIFIRSKSIFDPPRVVRSLPRMHSAEVVDVATDSGDDKLAKA